MVTLQWATVEHGKNCRAVEDREKNHTGNARHNCRAGAPKRANHALPSTHSSLLSTCPIRVHSWFKNVFRVLRVFRGFLPPPSGDARRNRRAGAPKRANHALPSPLSSLLSTCPIRVHSWFKNAFRVFRVFRGFLSSTSGDARRNRRAGAPKRANHALPSPLSSLLSTCPIRVHSWFKNAFRVFRVFRGFLSSTSGDARRNRRAGAPKRANHALPSTLSSLLPTLYYS